jgi:hypothetical protein
MTHYLITLVLIGSIIERKISADSPRLAICNLIQQIGKPKARVSSLTCKVAL